jgi:hypothetical protein
MRFLVAAQNWLELKRKHTQRSKVFVLARLTFRKAKNKKPYFRGSVVLHALQQNKTDMIKCVVTQLQRDRVSRHLQAYVPSLFAQAQLEET